MTLGPDRPGLYLHLPFCTSICPYCDFYVLTGNRSARERFLHLLLAEIEMCRSRPWPEFTAAPPQPDFDTIYLGGGTPSLLDPAGLQALVERVADSLGAVPRPWIGLEANPEDVTRSSLARWQSLGVRFLSLGIQSFDDRKLRFLGRVHDARTCRSAVELARDSGIETLSIDLIYGLPGETTADWERELSAAVSHAPDHLSCYQLTIEPGTAFGFRHRRGEMSQAPSETQADLFYSTHRFLDAHRFSAYEVSNFATDPAHRSRHNRKYWNRTPYLGLGPSAHSFIGRHRWWNLRKIKPWSRIVERGERPIADAEELDAAGECLERLLLGLRTPEGVDLDAFAGDTGALVWQANQALIDELDGRRLVDVEGHCLRPTLPGMAVAEAIASRFDLPLDGSTIRPRIC